MVFVWCHFLAAPPHYKWYPPLSFDIPILGILEFFILHILISKAKGLSYKQSYTVQIYKGTVENLKHYETY